MKKIFLIAGARPNFMKIAPIVRELNRRKRITPSPLTAEGSAEGEATAYTPSPLMGEGRGEGARTLLDYRIVHTGQHYDSGMSDVFFQELGIPEPDYHLGVGSGTHAEQTARIMVAFEKVCLEERPDLVMVVGDVNSTLACAIVAKKLCIPVAHVEAGLRNGDRTMPRKSTASSPTPSAITFSSPSQAAWRTCAGKGIRRSGFTSSATS